MYFNGSETGAERNGTFYRRPELPTVQRFELGRVKIDVSLLNR